MQMVRPGFTLVELLVAIVLLNVGLLALVGGSATLVRRHSAIHLRGTATRIATARLEQLATSPCRASSGELTHDGVNETWTTSALPHDVRELADSVAFNSAGATAAVTLRTRVRC
jgi:prepilin-type N-terminal cleavage/methylation domain-containing protein